MARSPSGDILLTTASCALASFDQTTPFILKIDIEGAEEDLFSEDTTWLDKLPLVVFELHDWMLPGKAASRTFIQAFSGLNRDLLVRVENVFSFQIRTVTESF